MRGAAQIVALVACAWGSTVAAGCEEVLYRDIDPQIRLTGADVGPPTGPPQLDVGFIPDGVFVSLAADPRVFVIYGLQTGTWTMPTLRTRGVGSFASVVCSVVVDATGEQVGQLDARTKFFPSLDGPLEVQLLPIRIRHAPPDEAAPIDDLFGQDAALDCVVEDEAGNRADARYDVTLVAG